MDDDWLKEFMAVKPEHIKSWMLLHSNGKSIVKELMENESLIVNTSCVMALTESINYKSFDSNHTNYGLMAGPGTVWLQMGSSDLNTNFMDLEQFKEKSDILIDWMHLGDMFNSD